MSSPSPVSLTNAAAERILVLLKDEENPETVNFRLGVSGGGCSGFQYVMGFDETVGEDDTIYLEKGVRMVIDEMSLPYLVGVVINFTEDLMGSSFEISNPNAQSSCGCGNSFSA